MANIRGAYIFSAFGKELHINKTKPWNQCLKDRIQEITSNEFVEKMIDVPEEDGKEEDYNATSIYNGQSNDGRSGGSTRSIVSFATTLKTMPSQFLKIDGKTTETYVSRRQNFQSGEEGDYRNCLFMKKDHPIRMRCIHLVFNPWFDRSVLVIIFLNSLFLAASDPVDTSDDQIMSTAEVVFNSFFTAEAAVRLTALGTRTYFGNSWNRLDFFVVFVGWIPSIVESFTTNTSNYNFSAIRTIRVLKVLRTIRGVEGMKKLVAGLLRSLPSLVNVMYLLSFIFLIFGIVGTQLFMGKFHQRCYERFNSTETLSWEWELVKYPNNYRDILCSKSNGVKYSHTCEADEVCVTRDPDTFDLNKNPYENFVAFDHIGLSFLTILTCISLEGWVEVMYLTFDTSGAVTTIYFLALVIFGALFVINLVVAVIYEAYMSEKKGADGEDEMEEHIGDIVKEAATLKTKMKSKHEMKKALGGRVHSPVALCLGNVDTDYWNFHERRDPILLKEAPNSRCGCKFHWRVYWFFEQIYLFIRDICYVITKNKYFQNLMYTMIGINTILLAMEYHGMSGAYENALEVANFIITYLFFIEMILKLTGFGFRNYVRDNWNNFDGFLAVISYVELYETSLGSFSAFRSLRILRVFRTFRLARRWKSLRKLIVTIGRSGKDVLNFMFLVLLFVLIYALCGMDLYGGIFPSVEVRPRENFDTLYFGLISVFQVMTGENWNETLYQYMGAQRTTSESLIAAVFFVTMFVVGHYIWLNLFLAILLDNFQKDQGDGDNTFFGELEANSDGKLVLMMVKSGLKCLAMPLLCLVYGFRYLCIIFTSWCLRCCGKQMDPYSDEDSACFPEDAFPDVFPRQFSKKMEGRRPHQHLNRMVPGKQEQHTIDSQMTEARDSPSSSSSAMGKDVIARRSSNPFPVRGLRRNSGRGALGGGMVTFNTEQPRQKNLHRVDTWEQEDELSRMRVAQVDLKSLILQMREEVPIGNHRRSYKFFVNCFPAAAVVDYLLDNDVVESLLEAIMVGQRLVEECFLAPASVKDKDDNWRFEDNSELLRFLKTPPTVVSLVNRKSKVDERQVRLSRRKLKDRQMKMAEGHSIFCVGSRANARRYAIRIATSPWFDNVVVFLIIFSTILLAMDEPLIEEGTPKKRFLTIADYFTTSLFTVECAIKIFAMGFVFSQNSYLRSGWNIMDFFIVLISWVTLAQGAANLSWMKSIRTLRTLRTLRALRPLRMISRSDGMKMVVNAILHAMPSVINVVFILILFFFIFAVVGLTMFSGKFYYCDGNGDVDKYSLDKDQCFGEWYNEELGMGGEREWVNLPSHFNHIGVAFVTTFELASLEMWPLIMWHAIDVTDVDKHPVRNSSVSNALFFIAFIICGSFFVTNLFVGVVINKFLEIKKKSGTSLFLTQQQVKWVRVQKQILSTRPLKMTQPPTRFRKLREPFYRIVRHGDTFEIVVIAAILLNVLIMGLEHYNQTDTWDQFFYATSILFTIIFGLEMLIKMLGLGLYQYFRNHWNKFDFAIVVLSIIEIEAQYTSSQLNLSIFRVLRTARIVRLVKRNKGLKDLFQTLIYSLPSLVNVGSLLILLIFVYGVMGMNLFHSEEQDGTWITEYNNFDTFGYSVLVLFRCATGESWNGIMHQLINNASGDAGSELQTLLYFITYMILCNFLLLNLFIAVILENFAEIVDQKKLGEGLEASHIKEFNKAWSDLDPRKTLFIPCFELVTLMYNLPKPLGLKGSEELERAERGQRKERTLWEAHQTKRAEEGSSIDEHIVFMLNHVRGLHLKRNEKGKVFYLDVLSALSKFAFDRDGEAKDIDFSHLEEDQVDQLTKELVTLSNHYEGTVGEISDDLPELDLTDEYNAAICIQCFWRGKKVRDETLNRLKREGRFTHVLEKIYMLMSGTKTKSYS